MSSNDDAIESGRGLLRAFLKHSRASASSLDPALYCASPLDSPSPLFRLNIFTPDRFYMGNQACDLDSMVSALALAFVDQLLSLPPEASPSSSTSIDNIIRIPILPIPRNDFVSRTEAVFLFQAAQVDLSSIVFLDDLPSGVPGPLSFPFPLLI